MSQTKKEFKFFEDFTNLYEVQKTLRFELKPMPETEKLLEDNGIVETDHVRSEKYEVIKKWFNRLHQEFVKDALSKFCFLDLSKYEITLIQVLKDRKNKNALDAFKKIEAELRQEVVDCFNKKANDWKREKYSELSLKQEGVEIFFKKNVFDILKERYGTKEETIIVDDEGRKFSIFDDWSGYAGYFDKFHETRKNFYKSDGIASALATRIVDQNLRRFYLNLKNVKLILSKIDLRDVELSLGISCESVFSLNFYCKCLLQDGIDIYNQILGGVLKQNGEKIIGINELVNKYNQNHKNDKLPFLKMLDKQILSEKEVFFNEIKDDQDLFVVLNAFRSTAEEKILMVSQLIADFVVNVNQYNLEKVYLSKEGVNTIMHKWMTNVALFEEVLFEILKQNKIEYETLRQKKDPRIEKKEGEVVFPNFIKIKHFKDALCDERLSKVLLWKERYYNGVFVETNNDNISTKWTEFLSIFKFEFLSLLKNHEASFEKFKGILSDQSPVIDKEIKSCIKDFADSVLWIYQMGKYFAIEKKRKWLEDYELCENFYLNLKFGYLEYYKNAYEDIVQVYNKLRNYLTKKPYIENQWKLNFFHPNLLKGFTESKTELSDNGTQYGAYLFRKTDQEVRGGFKYFLGVSKNAHLMSFFDEADSTGDSGFERLNYYQCKMKSIFGASYEGDYQEDKKQLSEIEIIQKVKKSLTSYKTRIPELGVIIDRVYSSVEDLRKDIQKKVNALGGSFTYKAVSIKQLKNALQVKNGFYLFEIKTKDLSNKKKNRSKLNLHTLYFNHLFKSGQTKLDIGTGEIFYRPKARVFEEDNIKTKRNNNYIEKEGQRIIHKRRFNASKLFLHLSVIFDGRENVPQKTGAKINFVRKFNVLINEKLIDDSNIHIIGIDRGEKNLVYYSVIDQKGNILETGSFNSIQDKDSDGRIVLKNKKKIETVKDKDGKVIDYRLVETGELAEKEDYRLLLEYKEKKRRVERQSWDDVENIKDLKKGYISQVVRRIADLAIKYNAIIVLEDLNMRFKQVRGGIERSVYQQLEKALIDKLSYLVFKDRKPEDKGGVLQGFQLTAPFVSFKDMGKQTGIIFYTQAGYTSKTCPACGFHRNVKFQFQNVEEAIASIQKIDSFEYNKDNDNFFISYQLSKFIVPIEVKKQKKDHEKRDNVLYEKIERNNDFVLQTVGYRYRWHGKNTPRAKIKFIGEEIVDVGELALSETRKGIMKKYDLTKCLINLFEAHGIEYRKGNFKEALTDISHGKEFFEDLFFYLYLLTETRQTISGSDMDAIQCPSCGFDSKNGFQGQEFNGDANGAYNIARKGEMILEKINQFGVRHDLKEMGWGDLVIDIEEWDKFTQKPV